MSWPTVRLAEVAMFIRGITFKPTDVLDEPTANSVGCMRTKNVQELLDTRDVWFLKPEFVSNTNQYLQEGDLLVSTANSWNLVGKACWVTKLEYRCTFGGFISALRANPEKIEAKYLYYWFTSPYVQEKLRSFSNKTTNISNLSLKRAGDLEIPLPPLAEQKRIADILDKAAEIKAKREQAIVKLDELAQSKYAEMFGSSEKFSGAETTLGKCLRLVNGRAYLQHELLDEGTPIIRIQNLNGGNKWYYSNLKLPDEKYCEEGDLLFAWSATFGPYIWKGSKSIYHYHIWKIEPFESVNKTFAYYLLQSITQQIKSASHGASMLHMTKSGMEAWPIKLPRLSEQKEFAEFIHTLNKIRMKYEVSISLLAQNNASLQHQAFITGFN